MSAPNLYGSNRAKAALVFDCSLLNGSDFITGTAANTGQWSAIQGLAAAVATVIDNGTTKTSVPIAAGVIIYGKFTSITLASGSVLAYK